MEENKMNQIINCPHCGEFLGNASDLDECPICRQSLINEE